MAQKIYTFRWREDNTPRIYESKNLKAGFLAVMGFCGAACAEGLRVSGFSIRCAAYNEPLNNISLRCS